MSKNIVNIMLENLLPENLVNDVIMDFHGGVESWLSEKLIKKMPREVKEFLRKGNFEITYNIAYTKVEIKVEKTMIPYIIYEEMSVNYLYRGRKKYIRASSDRIEKIEGNYIWTSKHKWLCLDKFDYLNVRSLYSTA